MSRCNSIVATLIALQCSIGCGNADSPMACESNDDCDSHFCKADGMCAPVGGTDAATDDGTPGTDAPTGLCSPNHDGMISQAELPLAAGRMAKFRTTTGGTFDTTGTAGPNGTRMWDLSTTLTGDGDSELVLLAPAGTWWAADFPTATYAAPLAAGSDLLGVFHVDAAALTLLGVVSPASGTFATKVSYDPPATILKLPLVIDATWTTTSSVSGTASGSFVFYDEVYASRVDESGTMKTPYGEFPVLRVATNYTQKSGVSTLSSKRQFAWTAECFGGVAAAVSQTFETADEFSDAAEIRRITP